MHIGKPSTNSHFFPSRINAKKVFTSFHTFSQKTFCVQVSKNCSEACILESSYTYCSIGNPSNSITSKRVCSQYFTFPCLYSNFEEYSQTGCCHSGTFALEQHSVSQCHTTQRDAAARPPVDRRSRVLLQLFSV